MLDLIGKGAELPFKLAARAGVELWEKPWVNMRASAVTDAADKFPGHVCEAWFGHSEAIANRHYRQVTEDHFQKAIGSDQKPVDAPAPRTTQWGIARSQPIARTPVETIPVATSRAAQDPARGRPKRRRKIRRNCGRNRRVFALG